ncbi:MAG: hypothetical protein ICV72_08650 [Aldersonia sp.]|nr:hypothetical protein [Aldersonia sp.]
MTAEVRKTLPTILAALHDGTDATADAVAASIGNRFAELTRPAPVRPLATVEAIAAITETTPVRWRHGLIGSVHPAHDRVELRLPTKTIDFPGECAAALDTLVAGRPVTAATLPGLSGADGLVVLRRLLREAVVVVA